MGVVKRRRLAVRRVYLGPAERHELAHSGFVQRDGGLEVVLYFDDGKPDYAATLPPRLARKLTRFLEDAMCEIDPLLVEDVRRDCAPSPART